MSLRAVARQSGSDDLFLQLIAGLRAKKELKSGSGSDDLQTKSKI